MGDCTVRPLGREQSPGRRSMDVLWRCSCAVSSRDRDMERDSDGFLSTWTNMDSDHQKHFILDLQTMTSTFQVFTISISRNSTHNIETWFGRGTKRNSFIRDYRLK